MKPRLRAFSVGLLKSIGIYDFIRNRYEGSHFGTRHSKRLFTNIFRENRWGDINSASGTGSNSEQTHAIVEALSSMLKEWRISTMLDLPCGDFHWMQRVDLAQVQYIGGDLVDELIRQNQQHFNSPNVQFRQLNLLIDRLPTVDLIFCRDCLVHLSLDQDMRALRNICQSDSRYLLTTTFPDHKENRDILTGNWRPLNLQALPFNLPEPLCLINEGCTESEDARDKSLGLWRIEDLRSALLGKT